MRKISYTTNTKNILIKTKKFSIVSFYFPTIGSYISNLMTPPGGSVHRRELIDDKNNFINLNLIVIKFKFYSR